MGVNNVGFKLIQNVALQMFYKEGNGFFRLVWPQGNTQCFFVLYCNANMLIGLIFGE